jgi:hypothetical protein
MLKGIPFSLMDCRRKMLIAVDRSNPKSANNSCAFIFTSASIEMLVETFAIQIAPFFL